MPETQTAILLMAFGGVESLDEVETFLQNIAKGRKPTSAMVNEVKERYRLIGGKSPLREITLRQALALQNALQKSKQGVYQVYAGMRYGHPYIKDTVCEIHEAGINNVTAIIMAPQKSGYTADGYTMDLDSALNKLDPKPAVTLLSGWCDNQNFYEAVAENVVKGLSAFRDKEETAVIFSAHSLPLKFMGPQDPYVKQVEETIKGVLSITGPMLWKLGYQSKGMIPGDWLEPSVDSLLEGLPKEGFKGVLIVPIGFVADHVETLYDIDIVYRKKAASLGLEFNRALSLNDSPLFIEALADIVLNQ